MIIRWFQTWLRQRASQTGQRGDQNKLVDIAHEVLSKEILEKRESLKGLEKLGWPFIRQRKKERVQKKVRRFFSLPLSGEESDEVVEEITEKIVEACEADPRIDRLFDQSRSGEKYRGSVKK